MDKEKLRPQVIALGQIYRLVTDLFPTDANYANAAMRPFRSYTECITKMHQRRAKGSGLQKRISELSDKINFEDWAEIFNTVVPLELQNDFIAGYYTACRSKIAVARKKKNLTQAQLAELVDVTQKDVSRWEQCQVVPGVRALKK